MKKIICALISISLCLCSIQIYASGIGAPSGVKAENGIESAIISWTSAAGETVRVYNDDMLAAEAQASDKKVEIKNLQPNTEYTFTVKSVDGGSESDGVTVTAIPWGKLSDTIDIISGLEVFKAGSISNWAKNFQWGNDTSTGVYLTHDAYEGDAAMLINPTGETSAATYIGINPTNSDLSKTNMVVGDLYKVVYYMKPLTLNSKGKYTLSKTTRYYDNYNTPTSKIYDIESDEEVTDNTNLESKWYRLEREFTASNSEKGGLYGISFMTWLSNGSCLVDSVTMYHKTTEGTWEAIADGTFVKNGDFEKSVSADNEAPENVVNLSAVSGDRKVTFTWDKPTESDLAGYFLYKDGEKIAEISRAAVSYTAENLENDVESTFKLVAYDRLGNNNEGTEITTMASIPEYIISDYTIGDSIVEGTNSVSLQIINNKNEDGIEAQIIMGLFDRETGMLIDADVSEAARVLIGTEPTQLSAEIEVDDIDLADYEIRVSLWKSIDSVSSIRDDILIVE